MLIVKYITSDIKIEIKMKEITPIISFLKKISITCLFTLLCS